METSECEFRNLQLSQSGQYNHDGTSLQKTRGEEGNVWENPRGKKKAWENRWGGESVGKKKSGKVEEEKTKKNSVIGVMRPGN